MTDDKLKLLKRYQYDKSKDYDADAETRTITLKERVDALDVYEYDGIPYIVSISWRNTEYGERTEYYCRSLKLIVYQIDAADVDNETKVREIVAGTKGFKLEKTVGPYLSTSYGDDRDRYGNYDRLYLSTQNEEEFTKDVCSRVIGAIKTFLNDEK